MTPEVSPSDGGQEVAFEVDGLDWERRLGWDVLVPGPRRSISDPEEVERLPHLGVFPWARAPARPPQLGAPVRR